MKNLLVMISRLIAYLMCLATAAALLILWRDLHDWSRLPIAILCQLYGFDMFISRQSLNQTVVMLLTLALTTIYLTIATTMYEPPNEPIAFDEVIVEHFNISLTGDCELLEVESFCYGESQVWFLNNTARIGVTAAEADNAIRMWGEFIEATDGTLCSDYLTETLCQTYLPLCDTSCQPAQSCELDSFLEQLCPFIGFHDDFYKDSTGQYYGVEQNWDGAPEIFAAAVFEEIMPFFGYELQLDDFCESTLSQFVSEKNGLCNQETADAYHDYEINGPTVTVQLGYDHEEIEAFNQESNEARDKRLHISLTVFVIVFVAQVIFWFRKSMRSQYYESELFNYSLILPKSRLFCVFLGCVIASLTYFLKSIENKFQYEGAILLLSSALISYTGCSAVGCILLQDHNAAKCRSKLDKSKIQQTPEVIGFGVKLIQFSRWFKSMFGVDGQYEYFRFVLFELIEVGIQSKVMLALVRSESTTIAMIHMTILSINLIVSPNLLLHTSPVFWRIAHRTVDSLLDAAYMSVLLLSLISSQNHSDTGTIVLGIFGPSYRLTRRLSGISFSVIRQGIVRKREHIGDDVHQEQESRFSPLRMNNCLRLLLIMLFMGIGGVLGVSTYFRVFSKIHECKNVIGNVLWESIEEHRMFPDGFFGNLSCDFESVNSLNVSQSGITEISESIDLFENLQELDLSNNDFTIIPESIGQLINLQKLDLSNNDLIVIPESIGQLANLTELDLSNNDLTIIPESIGQLANLTQLDLSNNDLTVIPESIGELVNLKELDLSYNDLIVIPESIGELVNLQELDLSNNDITTLPVELMRLEELFILILNGNPVTEELDWSEQGLQYFPGDFLQFLPHLERLYLRNNAISSIENESVSLLSLTVLDLSGNSMELLPRSFITSLESLIELNISHNSLRKLEDSIWAKPSLMLLDVSYNQLFKVSLVWGVRVDGFIAHAKDNPVTWLYWDTENTEILPKELAELSYLTDVNLYDSSPSSLGGILSLSSLLYLDVSSSSIPISQEYCQLKSLKTLDSLTLSGSLFACDEETNLRTLTIALNLTNSSLCSSPSAFDYWRSVENLELRLEMYDDVVCPIPLSYFSAFAKLRRLSISFIPITLNEFDLIPVNLNSIELLDTSVTVSAAEDILNGFQCLQDNDFLPSLSVKCTR